VALACGTLVGVDVLLELAGSEVPVSESVEYLCKYSLIQLESDSPGDCSPPCSVPSVSSLSFGSSSGSGNKDSSRYSLSSTFV
jgi:hypothetical protein